MLIFVHHAEEGLRLTEMIVEVRVFCEFSIELKYVLECPRIAEMQLSDTLATKFSTDILRTLTVLGATRTTGPMRVY